MQCTFRYAIGLANHPAYIHTLHMPGCTRWLISLGADASGSGFSGFRLFPGWFLLGLWLWLYWFLCCFLKIFLRTLCFFSSFVTYVHSWMMCSWVSSASQQYLHLRVSWPFLWFILTVIILVLALSIAWLCFLVSISMYSGVRSFGLVTWFLQWLIFVFSSASFFISFPIHLVLHALGFTGVYFF